MYACWVHLCTLRNKCRQLLLSELRLTVKIWPTFLRPLSHLGDILILIEAVSKGIKLISERTLPCIGISYFPIFLKCSLSFILCWLDFPHGSFTNLSHSYSVRALVWIREKRGNFIFILSLSSSYENLHKKQGGHKVLWPTRWRSFTPSFCKKKKDKTERRKPEPSTQCR